MSVRAKLSSGLTARASIPVGPKAAATLMKVFPMHEVKAFARVPAVERWCGGTVDQCVEALNNPASVWEMGSQTDRNGSVRVSEVADVGGGAFQFVREVRTYHREESGAPVLVRSRLHCTQWCSRQGVSEKGLFCVCVVSTSPP